MSQDYPHDNGCVLISEKDRDDARKLYDQMLDATPETILPLVNQYLTIMNGGVSVKLSKMPRQSCCKCHGRGYQGRDTKTGLIYICNCCTKERP
jgi:hypothetical protein